MINISIRIANFDKELRTELNKVIIIRVFRIINKLDQKIKKRIKDLIKKQPEYQAILYDNRIIGELGLANPQILEEIVNDWVQNVQVSFSPLKRDIGKIQIKFKSATFSSLVASPKASYTTEKGKTIKWLDWVLLKGSREIILGYSFLSKQSKASRTGYGIMIKKRLESWSVPEDIAGTYKDNFLTRALDELGEEIEIILKEEFEK
jgi:hypothetical protein